ncbi:hypothetical protein M3A74_09715 [Corynebacterium appendicis]|uniref:hypothetical protein n=1 Tax=Corynebacterium appendicis TaxID=163202 RepID=UPI00223B3AA8|nr:hypothetical protein [Corynebacterium appendicis]MCT1685076.1 hypothetical protein [Corynebacterium appendicis]
MLEPFQRYPEDEPGLGVWFSHGNFQHGQYDEQTKYGGIGEYTITRHADGELSLGKIRFMPTYTVGKPQTPGRRRRPRLGGRRPRTRRHHVVNEHLHRCRGRRLPRLTRLGPRQTITTSV